MILVKLSFPMILYLRSFVKIYILFLFAVIYIYRATIWALSCGREDLRAISASLYAQAYGVCAEHFEFSMFTSGLRNRLQSRSVMTIFAPAMNSLKTEIKIEPHNDEG